jgi:hypothetical protein
MINLMENPSMNAGHINSELLITAARNRFYLLIHSSDSLTIWLESLRFLFLTMGCEPASHDRLDRSTPISSSSDKEAGI